MQIRTTYTEALVVTGMFVARNGVTTMLRTRGLKVMVGPGRDQITVQTKDDMNLTQLQELIDQLVSLAATAEQATAAR